MRRPYPHVYPSIIGRDDLERDRIRDAVATVIFGMSHWVRQNGAEIIANNPHWDRHMVDDLADQMVDAFMESVPDDKMAPGNRPLSESEHKS